MDAALKNFLKKEFNINTAKCKEEEAAKKAWSKIEEFYKKIESLLYPDSSPAEMYEAENISRETRKNLTKAYREISKLKNYYYIALISNNKKDYKKFFTILKSSWKFIKETCIKALEESINAWEKEFKEEKEYYFG